MDGRLEIAGGIGEDLVSRDSASLGQRTVRWWRAIRPDVGSCRPTVPEALALVSG
jgi:hypothetical protein